MAPEVRGGFLIAAVQAAFKTAEQVLESDDSLAVTRALTAAGQIALCSWATFTAQQLRLAHNILQHGKRISGNPAGGSHLMDFSHGESYTADGAATAASMAIIDVANAFGASAWDAAKGTGESHRKKLEAIEDAAANSALTWLAERFLHIVQKRPITIQQPMSKA